MLPAQKEKSLRLSCLFLLFWITTLISSDALGSPSSLAPSLGSDPPYSLSQGDRVPLDPADDAVAPWPPPQIEAAEEPAQPPSPRPIGIHLDPVTPFRYPEEILESRLQEAGRLVHQASLAELQESVNRLYEAKLDTGFSNIPLLATLVLRDGYRSLEKGQIQAARLLGETARNLAPDFHPVYLYLSRLASRDPDQGVSQTLYWHLLSWKKRFQDFCWQYRTGAKIYIILVAGLYGMFLFQGPYLLLRYGRMGVHGLREKLRVGVTGFLPVVGLLALVGLGLLFLIGPFWAVVLVGFGLGIYARRWERILFLLLLIPWAFSPWIGLQAARFLSPLPDAVRALQASTEGEWDAAAASALESALKRTPDSPELLWAASLVAKRQGRYDAAEILLNRALLGNPAEGALWNNLGNLLAIRGRIAEAKDAYEKASHYSADLSAPHYNLSQILRREFSFFKGASEFQVARKLDPDQTEYFVYIHSAHPNRFFIDEAPPRASLWRHSLESSPQIKRAAADLWELAGARLPLSSAPLWIGLAALVYSVLILSGRIRGEVFRCGSCGRVVCRRCQPILAAGGMCNPCHQVLYLRDQIPKEHRQKQIREMARYRGRRQRIGFVTNVLLPGLGSSVAEDRARGAAVFLGFLLALLALLLWDPLFPSGSSGWEEPGGMSQLVPGCLLVALYLVLQYRNFRTFRERG